MAELELSALERQCLGRRFANEAFLRAECEAWVLERNQREVKIHWQFTAADARIRLRRLYPVVEDITLCLSENDFCVVCSGAAAAHNTKRFRFFG
jgi:hypothetical protein